MCKKINIMQNHFFICITKVYIFKYNITAKFFKSCFAGRRVSVFPCPFSGMLITFSYMSIYINAGIDKSYMTFISFRYFI